MECGKGWKHLPRKACRTELESKKGQKACDYCTVEVFSGLKSAYFAEGRRASRSIAGKI